MKILQINSVCGTGSTGKIAVDLYKVLKENGHECKIAYGRGEAKGMPLEDTIKIGSKAGVYMHALLSRLTDRTGFFSTLATKRFIKEVEKYNPDIIHLHNIHGYYINIKLLFKYLKRADKPVMWTLHDCWSFTGHCAYFDFAECDKWKTTCKNCPQKESYPAAYIDRCSKNFENKKKIFTSVQNMTFITPSKWLADLLKKSYLGEYPVEVIYNGIDTEVFKPTESDFKKKYGIENKKIILGVASIWEKRKGLLELVKLNEKLSDDYQIVVVGKLENQVLPENIIHIDRTESQTELAEIYTAADVFVNPTREEVFGLVNIEALACGTPVITYKTGGSPEAIDETCGAAVNQTADELLDAIMNFENFEFCSEACRKRAESFNKEKKYKEYISLYYDSAR